MTEKSNAVTEEVDAVQQKESEEPQMIEKTVSEPGVETSTEEENVLKETDENVAEAVEMDTKELQTHKCPRCGGNLVLRTASRGVNAGNQFWGCENFPKCRYIRNMNDV